MAFKQKMRVKNVRNKYLKPGALAQLCYNKATSRSCRDIGKKRVVLVSQKAKMNVLDQPESKCTNTSIKSFDNVRFPPTGTGLHKITRHHSPLMPRSPAVRESDSLSILESLPIELLVKILCHLHHDQLKAVFHVSQSIRTAVLLARQYHFNYTTPDRTRQERLSTKTPLATEYWPFVSKGEGKGIFLSIPLTPKGPKHGPRPPHPHQFDMKQIAAVLFQDPALPSKLVIPSCLPRPVYKSLASSRVLFCEEELCQAVAQNKLL